MKKIAIFLVFTLLLTTLSGMTTVFAAHTYQETFEISATEPTVIAGNCYTRTGWTDSHNQYTFWYAIDGTSTQYAWSEWDLNVLEAGMYKISIKSGTDGGASTMRLFKDNKEHPSEATQLADVVVSNTVVPGMVNSIWDNTETELATLYLEEGKTSIGMRNYGDRKYVHEIIITPVEDNIKIVKTVSEYASRSLTDNNTYTDSATGEKHNHVHSSKYVNYKIKVPETGNYLLSLNYGNHYTNTYAMKATVSVGATEDALTALETFTFPAKTKTGGGTTGATANLVNVPLGIVSLTAGEQYIQIKGSAEPYIGTMTLEKMDSNEKASTLIDPIFASSVTIASGIEKKYAAENGYDYEINAKNMEETYKVSAASAGTYDLYMNIATQPTYGYQIALSVNGTQQSFVKSDTSICTGWSDYQYIKVGSVTLPKGTSAITINSTGSSYVDAETGKTRFYGYMYFKDFKLLPSGSSFLANTYTDTEPTFTTTSLNTKLGINTDSDENTDNVVRLAPNTSVSYTVNAEKTGLYSISAIASAKTIQTAVTISANGRETESYPDFSTARRYEFVNLGYAFLKEGENTVTITLDAGIALDLYAIYTDAPSITLYEGTSTSKEVTDITVPEGGAENVTYTAKARLNGIFKDKKVIYTIALYDGSGKIAALNCLSFTSSGAEEKNIALSGLNLVEGTDYTVKVFLWDGASLFGETRVY